MPPETSARGTGHTVRAALASPRDNALTAGRRLIAAPDVVGPRVTLGLAWFAVTLGAVALGIAAVTVVFALTAGVAAYQTARAWRERQLRPDPWVAAAGAVLIGVAGAFATQWVGVAVLVLIAAALITAWLRFHHRRSPWADAGYTMLAALFVGIAAAAIGIVYRYDIGAVVIIVLLVCVYDAGNFLVGAGASNPIEGPLAGGFAVMAVTFAVAVLRVPPFHGLPAWPFGAAVAVLCPLGQFFASSLLPRADANAPALRRLDTLLITAPVWAGAIGLFLQHHH
jgi:hypothetical protein